MAQTSARLKRSRPRPTIHRFYRPRARPDYRLTGIRVSAAPPPPRAGAKGRNMIRQLLRRFAFTTLLFICLAGIVNGKPADQDEVEQALSAIGSGSAPELNGRLFTHRITVWDAEFRAWAIDALPAAMRNQRLTEGKLLRRVEAAFQQVLQLHGRSGKVELFVFEHDLPLAQLWRGCVLMISNGMVESLLDGELSGILAHELGHSYFEDEMAAAQRTQDTSAQRIVELKCDAVAILTLKLMGHNPAFYLKGLQRIRTLNQRKSRSSGILQSHPELVARARFSERFIRSIR